ncbi:MAG TPA: CvpA family protein [Candidatus Anaerostipes avistercoris]|uniref:CvpA family protein n=1 Tax=Candidatus Anaerostipes avistercoris TaxID=2838462 RepID=A0A9D2T6N9_9FIRM|nr:CvpA family protein [uncultured Anaerostipes sp.]HJC49018.1 CvpA family protein [Candidatus Anaerostipes avistercoris]
MGEIILIILLLYLLIQVVSGYRKGFLHAALTLAAWILTFAIAYYAADYFKAPVAQYIMRQPQNFLTDQIAYVIAFILVTIVVRIIFSFVIRFINKINNLPGIGFINKIAGGVLGFAKGSLVIMFVCFFISLMPVIGLSSQYSQVVRPGGIMEMLVESNPFTQMLENSTGVNL